MALALALAWLLAQRAAAPRGRPADAPLSDREVDALCEEWEPEPLVPATLPDGRPRSAALGGDAPALLPIPGARGAAALLASSGKRVLVAAGTDFLGLTGDPTITKAAAQTIAKYGVGSCGPRGFYGTVNVHLSLEAALAAWQGTAEAIVYSHDIATMPSVLPAFASAKDVIVLDDAAPWALANGAALSRARVATFRHGSLADLEAVLARLAAADAAASRPPCRRFIVVEGVAAATGGLAPLPAIVALKRKFAYRLVVDESLAAGVLGPTHGRGACEHWGLAPGDADVIVGSLGGSLASVGGWCAASREVVDHQRLSGLGYCFSASLPPFLAVAAEAAVGRVTGPEGVSAREALARNGRLLREALASDGGVPGFVIGGAGCGGGCGGCGGGGSGGGASAAAAVASPYAPPASPRAAGRPASPILAASVPVPPPAPRWYAPTLHLFPAGLAEAGGNGGGEDGEDDESAAPSISPSARARAALLCKAVAADCLDKGSVLVAAVEPVPGGEAEARVGPSLRLTLTAAHGEADVRRVAAAVKGAARRCGAGAALMMNKGGANGAHGGLAGFVARTAELKRQESQQSLGGGW